MKDFKDNNCRLCKQVFCCKNCREKHEISVHKIFPQCDICVYGKTLLTNASEDLLNHIKNVHLPLHCIFCKKIFGSSSQLLQHNKCPIGFKFFEDKEKSPYTPGHSYAEITYDSPPFASLLPKVNQSNKNMLSNLATSTPMQRNDDLLQKIEEVITPVDCSDINKDSMTNKKKFDAQQSDCRLKRKVTFCETPSTESYGTGKNKQDRDQNGLLYTPVSGSSTETFYTVKEELEELNNETDKNGNKSQKSIPTIEITEPEHEKALANIEVQSKSDDTTVWVSAVNISATDFIEEDSKVTTDINHHTPIMKKRQVNVVMPTPVLREEEINIQFNIPIPISSTPNIQPIASMPKVTLTTEENTNLSNTNLLHKNKNETQKNLNKEQDTFAQTDTGEELLSDKSLNAVHNRLWTSMSRLLKNVLQGFTSMDENVIPNLNISSKRSISECDSYNSPCVKRYKLTKIKCRRTIRELPEIEITREIRDNAIYSYSRVTRKVFVDKATQTDS